MNSLQIGLGLITIGAIIGFSYEIIKYWIIAPSLNKQKQTSEGTK